MPDFHVIQDVSHTLVEMINDAINDAVPVLGLGRTVAALHDLSDPNATPPLLSVFLFEVMEDASARNLPLVRQSVPDPNDATKTKVVVKKPPMALQLNYLFTPWVTRVQGDPTQVDTDHVLLGFLLQLFYDEAIVNGPQLRGVLAGTDASLKISMHQITLEDRTRIWHALQRPYRTSLSYGVRVVHLDPDSRKDLLAEPVSTSGLRSRNGTGVTP